MHIRLGDTDGNIYVSNEYTNSQMLDYIDERGGRLGDGHFANVRVENLEDAFAFIERVLDATLADDDGKVTLEVGDETLRFKSKNVGWFRVVR